MLSKLRHASTTKAFDLAGKARGRSEQGRLCAASPYLVASLLRKQLHLVSGSIYFVAVSDVEASHSGPRYHEWTRAQSCGLVAGRHMPVLQLRNCWITSVRAAEQNSRV